MFAPPMRPRFRVTLDLPVEAARDRIVDPLRTPPCPVEGLVAGHHVELKIPAGDRHFWSPHLSLEVESAGDRTLLRGLFGPRPSVWTMFATLYMALVFIAFFGSVLGVSQWLIDKPAWGFWALPFSGVVFLGAYTATLFGQRLGREQMATLREYLRACFEGVAVHSEDEATEAAVSPQD